ARAARPVRAVHPGPPAPVTAAPTVTPGHPAATATPARSANPASPARSMTARGPRASTSRDGARLAQAAVFDHQAAIHHHRDPGGFGLAGDLLVEQTLLQPQRLGLCG